MNAELRKAGITKAPFQHGSHFTGHISLGGPATTLGDFKNFGHPGNVIEIAGDVKNVFNRDQVTAFARYLKIPFPWGLSASIQLGPSEGLADRVSVEHALSVASAAREAWNGLVPGGLPDSLIVDVVDLPGSRIAAANLVDASGDGVADTGVVLVDGDAGGVGWFVDATPEDNTEYGEAVGDNAHRALLGSEAYGRYDLYSALLHELGHLLGIHARLAELLEAGTIEAAGLADVVRANFTPDGHHLSNVDHPYDLMNEQLDTGVRLLPSEFDVSLVSAAEIDVDFRGHD
jgi:hypothetical protein